MGKREDHICGYGPKKFIQIFGGGVLYYDRTPKQQETWEKFVEEIRSMDVERDALLEFMVECSSVSNFISNHKQTTCLLIDMFFDGAVKP